MYKTSIVQGLYKSSPYKISIRALRGKILRKTSLTIEMSTAPQRERSDRPKVTRRLREPFQNEYKVTRGSRRLNEAFQNEHRATTRAT